MCPPPRLKSKPLLYMATLAILLVASLFIPRFWPEPAPSRPLGSMQQPPAESVTQPSQRSR